MFIGSADAFDLVDPAAACSSRSSSWSLAGQQAGQLTVEHVSEQELVNSDQHVSGHEAVELTSCQEGGQLAIQHVSGHLGKQLAIQHVSDHVGVQLTSGQMVGQLAVQHVSGDVGEPLKRPRSETVVAGVPWLTDGVKKRILSLALGEKVGQPVYRV